MSISALDVLLQEAGLIWLIPFASGVEAPLFDLPTFCATDPPARPTITQADVIALATPALNPAGFLSASAKVRDLISIVAWYAFCECTSGTQPTQPAPLVSAPSGVPTQIDANPSICVAAKRAQCKVLNLWNGTTNVSPPANWELATFDDSAWITPPASTGTVTLGDTLSSPHGIAPKCSTLDACKSERIAPWAGAPATGKEEFLVRWRFSLPDVDTGTLCVRLQHHFDFTGSGGWSSGTARVNGGNLIVAGNNGSWSGAMSSFVPGDNLMAVWVNSSNSSSVNTWGTDGYIGLVLSIAGAIGVPSAQGCCPPDPMLQSQLTQIQQAVNLIQRQTAPFAYVTGATHTGLTGTGEITVQGLLGVKVLPTTVPGSAGVDFGDPDFLWLDSWINWGNADGWAVREPLRASPHVSLPALAGQFTKIGYTLRPGLTVSITELVREP